MKILNNLRVRTKLILLNLLIVIPLFVGAALLFIAFEKENSKHSAVESLKSLSAVTAYNLLAPIEFQDKGAAEQILTSLASEGTIVSVALYDNAGNELAHYKRDKFITLPQLSVLEDSDLIFNHNQILLKYIVKSDMENLGTMVLVEDLSEIQKHQATIIKQTVSTLLIAILLSTLLCSWLQGIITKPISELVEISQQISTKGDYSLRASRFSNDEVGELVEGFNQMLAQIEVRDNELATHRDQLEEEVKARTAQLVNQNVILERARDDADAANKAKSVFLANMSHELRTPLNGILGMANLVIEESVPDHLKESIETIRESGMSLLNTVNDILDFSKADIGKMELDPRPNLIQPLLEKIVKITQPIAKNAGLNLISEIDPLLPPIVMIDAHRFEQVMVNLIGNAIKFTKNGSVTLIVNLKNQIDQSIFLEISVKDTGIGISEDKINTIFDSFAQADTSISRRFGGTGLGLAISSRLVNLMGGELRVKSIKGEGSEFYFNILVETPDEKLDLEELQAEIQKTACLEEEIILDRQQNILVAEDNIVNQRVVRKLLEKNGFNVTIAENGFEAVEYYSHKNNYCIILMDIQMPGMDGIQATKKIREMEKVEGNQRIPIIALTAHALPEFREEYISVGMDEHITKPLDAKILIDTINNLTKSRP